MKKFMLVLGCRFSFEEYAKNVIEKTTELSLKAAEVLLNSDGHELI